MPDWMWWIIIGYLTVRVLAWLFAPHFRAPTPRLQSAHRPDGAHDAAVSIAAVLGVRDGLHD